MMKNVVTKSAKSLRAGDVLACSGFTVTHNAWSGVRTPKGKVVVEGFYPGSPVRAHKWSAHTVVQVRA